MEGVRGVKTIYPFFNYVFFHFYSLKHIHPCFLNRQLGLKLILFRLDLYSETYLE